MWPRAYLIPMRTVANSAQVLDELLRRESTEHCVQAHMASARGSESGRKGGRTVVLQNDSRRLEVKPGIRGGTFYLPQVDWASQTGRIEVSPNLFGRKDRLSCTVFEPWERHGKTPPFSRASDHLLSEVRTS